MQEKNSRRSNAQRTEETRAALIKAGRSLFIDKGYAETSTPDIVKAAGVTRGALYHHFKDKAELFAAILEKEAEAIGASIASKTSPDMAPLDAMIAGSAAYFDAMSVPGRAQMLLTEGPAALGPEAFKALGLDTGEEELRIGLAVLTGSSADDASVAVLADLLSAMFDRAALSIAIGADAALYKGQVRVLLTALAQK